MQPRPVLIWFLFLFMMWTDASAQPKNCQYTINDKKGKAIQEQSSRRCELKSVRKPPTKPGFKPGPMTTEITLSPPMGKCYSWRATLYSAVSPYVQLLAPEDLNAVNHIITEGPIDSKEENITKNRCRHIAEMKFIFPGEVEWIELFADPADEGKPALSDQDTPEAVHKTGFTGFVRGAVKWLQNVTEAPGATNIQASWSPSFNGPQKVSLYANLKYLLNIPGHNEWLGISSLLDINNPAQQNLDSTINTVTYVRYLTPVHFPADGHHGFQIRPLMLELRSGAEYALSSDVLNQISSLSLHLPIISPRVSNQESPVSLTPMAGFETGENFDNRSVKPLPSEIFRWVTGTDGSYRFHVPKAEWFLGSKPYTLSGAFRARFPTTAEVFTTVFTTMNNSTVFETPDRRTRIYGRAELSIPLTKLVAASVIYQYGDLPPAFRFSGHTVSISLRAASPTDYEH